MPMSAIEMSVNAECDLIEARIAVSRLARPHLEPSLDDEDDPWEAMAVR